MGQAITADGVTERNFAKEAHLHIAGDITASSTVNVPTGRHVVHTAGQLVDVFILAEVNGEDAVDPLSLEVDVDKNGTTMLATLPKLDKAAGSGKKSTMSAGTGITQAVLKSDGAELVAKEDLITIDVTMVRTTPDTEFNGLHVVLLFADDLVSFSY